MGQQVSNQFATYAVITPDNTVNIAQGVTDAIFVGTTGNLVAVSENGATATFVAAPAGVTLPLRVKRINSTSTTADNLLALYVSK